MGQAVVNTQTYTGNPASFICGAGDTITALSVPITPSQSLNGYSKPWAGGAGENLFEPRNGVDNQIYFTVQSDGSVKISGTANIIKWTAINVDINLPFNGIDTGDTVTIWSDIMLNCTPYNGNTNLGQKSSTNGNAVTFTIPANATKLRFSQCAKSSQVTAGEVIDTVGHYFFGKVNSFSSWTPYSNICPINGLTGLSAYVSPTYDIADATTYPVDWTADAGTVYGGTLDMSTGVLTVDTANIASYNGEAIGEPWLSSMDEYVSGGTPTTGAQVVYTLTTTLTYTLTAQTIALLTGQNYIWSDIGSDISITILVSGFQGWLIKVVNNGTPVEIPLKYMRAETYTVTPDQRMEWSAERDVTGVLHRETVANTPPKIEFSTPLMTNSDIAALNTIIQSAFTNALGRDITVQFYDPEKDEYWEWDCYMPDVHYSIRNVDIVNRIINYEELRYAFIGY